MAEGGFLPRSDRWLQLLCDLWSSRLGVWTWRGRAREFRAQHYLLFGGGYGSRGYRQIMGEVGIVVGARICFLNTYVGTGIIYLANNSS